MKLGLVKDYNRAKLKKRGWSSRYDDDGVAVGGTSYHGQKRWEEVEVIVDPVTGETRKEQRPAKKNHHSGSANGGGFPSPWSNDPLNDEYDSDEDSVAGYAEREQPESADRRDFKSSQAHRAPRSDQRNRDPVTGAIIEDPSPKRRQSGQSLHDQYADRYKLGGGGSRSSLSLSRRKSNNGNGNGNGNGYAGDGLPGAGDAGLRAQKTGSSGGAFGGLFGRKSKKHAQANESHTEYVDGGPHGYGNGNGYANGNGHANGNGNGNGYADANGYGYSDKPSAARGGGAGGRPEMQRDPSAVRAGAADGLNHQF